MWISLDDFNATARSFNRFLSLSGNSRNLERQLAGCFTVAEDLHEVGAVDETVLVEALLGDFGETVLLNELVDAAEVEDLVLYAERILEAALRHPALDRHLAAFEALLGVVAGTSSLALATLCCRGAVAGAFTATYALCFVDGAFCRTEIGKIHETWLVTCAVV